MSEIITLDEIDSRIQTAFKALKLTELTDIQARTYEKALKGNNILGCSKTGTGKTFAYLIPTFVRNNDDESSSNKTLYSIIVAPGKELCIQICSQINKLSNNSGIPVSAVAVFGGVNTQRQLQALKTKPNIIVGTFQRISELICDKKISVHNVKTLIFDEADKLLVKENMEEIKAFRKHFLRDTQIMCFSASINEQTRKNAENLSIHEFVNILTNERLEVPKNIEHIYFSVEKRDAIETSRKVIKALNVSRYIIFSNSRYETDEIYQKLNYHKYNVGMIHAGLKQNQKRQVIDDFQAGKTSILICSDITARGLDFDNVDAVINIGLPDKNTDYLHRAGRCGRNGQKAVCASIITENDLSKVKSIRKSFSLNFIAKKVYQGKIVKG